MFTGTLSSTDVRKRAKEIHPLANRFHIESAGHSMVINEMEKAIQRVHSNIVCTLVHGKLLYSSY